MNPALLDVIRRHDRQARTHVANIAGFAEMLADPARRLSEAQRLEYAEIVFASALALEKQRAAFLDVVQNSGR